MLVNETLVVVTGASRGIGAASARALALAGARVVLLARSEDALEAVARDVEQLGSTAWSYPVDLSDLAATEAVCSRIADELGTPDVVFNNAGAGRWLYVEETDSAELLHMTAVPYLAAFTVTRCFLPAMLQRGSGRIVNITSPVAYTPWPGATAYASARWAMRGFSEALRLDLHGTGVGVTLLVPGEVESTYFSANPGVRERVPGIGRIFRTLAPEDVAEMLLYALRHDVPLVVQPRLLALMLPLARAFPGVFRLLTRATGHKR